MAYLSSSLACTIVSPLHRQNLWVTAETRDVQPGCALVKLSKQGSYNKIPTPVAERGSLRTRDRLSHTGAALDDQRRGKLSADTSVVPSAPRSHANQNFSGSS